MKILGLCMYTDLFSFPHSFESIDISLGRDVLSLPNDYGQSFDLIVAAPPCTQFTKANSSRWLINPDVAIAVAIKCLVLCIKSGRPWFIENPPGRLPRLIPAFLPYKRITLSDIHSNKEWVIYSNLPVSRPNNSRYGKQSISNFGLVKRNTYPLYFFTYLEQQLNFFGLLPGQGRALCLDLVPGQCSGLITTLLQELDPGLSRP